MLQIHIAAFLFGFAGLFGKFISSDPLVIVFGRTFFAAIALYLYGHLAAKTRFTGINRTRFLFFILQGVLLAVHWWSFFLSIRISSVAVGLVTYSTFPLFVTFMEPFFFRERLEKKDIAIALAVFAGIVLVIPEFDFSNTTTQGAAWGVFSGFTFALLALVNRKNARTGDAITVAFYQNLFASLFLFFPLILTRPAFPAIQDWPDILFLGVVCTALSHTLFIHALKIIRAQTASIIAGLEPVYGIALAFILLSEIPTLRTLSGGIIIIGATIAAGMASADEPFSGQ